MSDEVNSPRKLAEWAVAGMLPVEGDELMRARAEGITKRVEIAIKNERACDARALDRSVMQPDTLVELRQSATMIRRWLPEAFPENEHGQVHFVRCVMESVAVVIERALAEFAAMPAPEEKSDAE